METQIKLKQIDGGFKNIGNGHDEDDHYHDHGSGCAIFMWIFMSIICFAVIFWTIFS